jgi:type IV secretion system protein VirB8
MKQSNRDKLEAYYSDGASWADDRLRSLRTSRRVAWIIAAVAVLVALFEAVALIFLAPLKTVVPYTLMVDRTTGFVQELKPLDAQTIAPDAALIQSFLVQYVIAREGFAFDDVQNAYKRVTLWSSADARSQYIAAMQASNPDSPLSRYPRQTVVDATVKSVSTLGPRTALVRFETRRRDAGGRVGAPSAWVTVIRYRFTSRALTTEDRFLNPLGFQVVSYRRSAEALPPAEPVVVAPPSGSIVSPTVVAPAGTTTSPVVVVPGRGTTTLATPTPRARGRPVTPQGIEVTL